MKTIRSRITRPFSRTALVVLAWTYRHTLGLWARSLTTELRRPEPFDQGRFRRLVSSLIRVSTDPLTANARELKRLRIDNDTVDVDVDEGWSRAQHLVMRLRERSDITDVRVPGGVGVAGPH